MKNLIMGDFRSVRILVKFDKTYYYAEKLGAHWGLCRLIDPKIYDMTQDPPAPWITIQDGEYLHYSRMAKLYNAVLTHEELTNLLKALERGAMSQDELESESRWENH